MYWSQEVNMSEKERVVFGVFLLQPNKSKIMILKVPSSLKSKSTIHGFPFSPLWDAAGIIPVFPMIENSIKNNWKNESFLYIFYFVHGVITELECTQKIWHCCIMNDKIRQLNDCLLCDLRTLFLRIGTDPVFCTNLVDYPKFSPTTQVTCCFASFDLWFHMK